MSRNDSPSPQGNGPKRALLSSEEWLRLAYAHCLSNRELSVLLLSCQGLTRKAMARRLGIGLDSVQTYCGRLHRKMEVHGRAALLQIVLQFALDARRGK
jgi:DNA-binding CsgD family transcriptional regulator